ncbi:MAG: hypothetical protein ACFFCS_26455 [Candidatus Hodarchaeota archaeon]
MLRKKTVFDSVDVQGFCCGSEEWKKYVKARLSNQLRVIVGTVHRENPFRTVQRM